MWKKQDNSSIFQTVPLYIFEKFAEGYSTKVSIFHFSNSPQKLLKKKVLLLRSTTVYVAYMLLYNLKSKNKNLLCVSLYKSSPLATHAVTVQNLADINNKFIVFTDLVKCCSCYVRITIKFLLNTYRWSSPNSLSFVQIWLLTQFIELVTKQQTQIYITLVVEGEGLKSRQGVSLGVWPLTSTNLKFYHASPGYIYNLLDQGHHVSLADHLSVYLPQSDLGVNLDKTIA